MHQPMVFPGLGPTALLLFEHPLQRAASPRNAILGHLVALAIGYACVVALGLTDLPGPTAVGLPPARIAAAALSVSLTGAALVLLHAQHPPAGATTLTVSLGLLTGLKDLAAIAVGVVVITVASLVLNRAVGVRMPLWRAGPHAP